MTSATVASATAAPISTHRGSRAGPLVAAGLAVAGAVYVGVRNPATQGGFLPCPFHALTGLWCPGCGMTRALHQLLRGDVAGALSANLFLPVVLVVGIWTWLAWWTPRVPPIGRVVPSRVWGALVAAAFVFAVLRNLPVPALQTLAP